MTEGTDLPTGGSGPADPMATERTAGKAGPGATGSAAVDRLAQGDAGRTADPHAPGAAGPSRNLIPADQRWTAVLGLLRALASIIALVVAYYLLPLDHPSDAKAVVAIVAGILGVAVVVGWQVRTILKADHPGLKAVEALAIIVPLFLVLIATAYYLIERATPASFGQSLSRTDALYFTVTTFTTVGYGDIAAKTQAARIMVTLQMLADLIILGVAVKVIFQAAQRGLLRRPAPQAERSPDSTSTPLPAAMLPGEATGDTVSQPHTQPPLVDGHAEPATASENI